ncbi:MAG: IS4 family transposase [Pseudomonadales bacterium]|nr:IS4 family transposase [Pseudomonadales bacterium]
MIKHASIFSQLLTVFSRADFAGLVKECGSDYRSKGFSSWSQFVCMLFCHLAQAKSLREICNGLRCCLGKLKHLGILVSPNKSTLSYANSKRPWVLYEKLFYQTLDRVQTLAPSHKKKKSKFRFRNRLYSIDATVIDLCLGLFPWAKFRRTKGAVKLHMLLDHQGYLPSYALITEGAVSDIHFARLLDLPPDSIVAMDRAYNDYEMFAKWTDRKIWFVTRMKSNTVYQVVEERKTPQKGHILSDQIIRLTGTHAGKKCPNLLRKIEVWDEENERDITLLTNHMEFGATTISAIYKDRWEIELFFKALKQNLKIKTFVGTSANALKIQIWTALIAILLIKYLQFKAKLNWSLSNLVALLRLNLFTYRDIWAWLNDPFDTPPEGIQGMQLKLNFPA